MSKNMLHVRTIVIGTVVSTLLLFRVAAYGKDNKIIPEALLEIAEQNNCKQVSDYYEGKPGVVKPPYLYGYISGPEENSAVFWCEKRSARGKSYTLMFILRNILSYKDEESELTTCPDIEGEFVPGGLSVYRDRKMTLEGFVSVHNPKVRAPQNLRFSHNGIEIDYGGTSTLLYCHKGKWFYLNLD